MCAEGEPRHIGSCHAEPSSARSIWPVQTADLLYAQIADELSAQIADFPSSQMADRLSTHTAHSLYVQERVSFCTDNISIVCAVRRFLVCKDRESVFCSVSKGLPRSHWRLLEASGCCRASHGRDVVWTLHGRHIDVSQASGTHYTYVTWTSQWRYRMISEHFTDVMERCRTLRGHYTDVTRTFNDATQT